MSISYTERYVTDDAPGGGDGSAGNPWTWDESLANFAAGDRVNVKVGNYTTSGTTTATSGTSSQPVVFRGYQTTIGDLDSNSQFLADGTEMPVINASSGSPGFTGNSHIAINHISFKSSTAYAISAWKVKISLVRACKFVNTSTNPSTPVELASNTRLIDSYVENKSNYSLINGSVELCSGCVFNHNNGGARNSSSGGGMVNINCLYLNLSTGIAWSYKTVPLYAFGCTFVNCANGINLGTAYNYVRTVRNCYFDTCTNGIVSSVTDDPYWFVDGCGYRNVTNETVNIVSQSNSFNDSVEQFEDSASGDYRLKSSSNAYSAAPPRYWPGINIANNRDIGALQHADAGGGGGLSGYPLSRLIGGV